MAPDVSIRSFEWADLNSVTHLFNRINEVEGTSKEFDLELMRQTLSLPSVSPLRNLHLAQIGSEVVGYVLVSPEVPIGRAVAAGGILDDFRGRGAGRQLLKTAIQRARSLGVSVLDVQTSRDAGPARTLLESEGFERVKDYWQMRWEGGELPQLGLRPEFQLESFVLDRDEATLTEIQNAAFGEHWGFCPNTVEEIAARVRMKDSDPDGIIFVMHGDRPAGYNWTLRNVNSHGSIGLVSMTGVHPEYRGNGLGTAVVVTGMQYLRDIGVEAVELEVDAENAPAIGLYTKLGYRQVHHSVWYELKLR